MSYYFVLSLVFCLVFFIIIFFLRHQSACNELGKNHLTTHTLVLLFSEEVKFVISWQ